MQCQIIKTAIKTPLGTFLGFRRAQPTIDVAQLLRSGSLEAMPINCWLSRILRTFRREGRIA